MEEYLKLLTEYIGQANCLIQRMEAIEERQKNLEELVASVAVLAQRMGTVEGNVNEIKGNVHALMAKPGKRWDGVVEKALLVVVGAIVAWLLSRLGIT